MTNEEYIKQIVEIGNALQIQPNSLKGQTLKKCIELLSVDVISIDQANAMIKSYVSHYEENKGEWIPVSERLPKEREWYLAVFKEKDTNFHLIPRVADYIGHGENRWQLINEEGLTQEYLNLLECVAWQPLPEPYKKESEDL